MTRTPRLLALLVPAALVGSLVATVPAQAAAPASSPSATKSGQVRLLTGGSTRSLRAPLAASTPLRAAAPSSKASKSSWPVGYRTATLTRPSTVTPSGAPAQQITSAQVEQLRADKRFQFKVVLGAVPDASTDAELIVAFGKVTADGTACSSPAGANQALSTFKASGGSTATLNYYVTSGLAKTGDFDCAFVNTTSADGATRYDDYNGALVDHIQKPSFALKVKSAPLTLHRWVRLIVTVKNSKHTIAKAPHTTLSWKTFGGIDIRGKKSVGTIKPGQTKRVNLQIRASRPHSGKIKVTATSRSYHRSISAKVKPIKRRHHR